MQTIYTAEEVAELLELELDSVIDMAQVGSLSGFHVDDEWRTTHDALLADLHRAKLPQKRQRPFMLVPRTAEAQVNGAEAAPVEAEEQDIREHFRIRINVDNDANFSGEFRMRLSAEGENDAWEALESEDYDVRDAEIRVKHRLGEGDIGMLFEGTLHASFGDRLFVTVPEQQGIDRPSEQVFILDDHTDVKLTLVRSGFFGRHTGIKFARL